MGKRIDRTEWYGNDSGHTPTAAGRARAGETMHVVKSLASNIKYTNTCTLVVVPYTINRVFVGRSDTLENAHGITISSFTHPP